MHSFVVLWRLREVPLAEPVPLSADDCEQIPRRTPGILDDCHAVLRPGPAAVDSSACGGAIVATFVVHINGPCPHPFAATAPLHHRAGPRLSRRRDG